MSEPLSNQEQQHQQAVLARALHKLRDLQARLETLEARERARTEPVAIVGMACRFPGGADTPEAFWHLLHSGTDAIGEIPAERWNVDAYYHPDPDTPGTMYTRNGGFLQGVDLFDAPFFGISAREAASMDPQQRLLLEVAWEALERAGQPADTLVGTRTGVFLGVVGGDYAQLQLRSGDPQQIDIFSGTGNAASVAAGRIAYVLGVNGPALAVDTACSSSLVALHLACQSLRAGECSTALAGGIHLMLTPDVHIYFSRLRAMARDGRCKTFDAAADGYGRGEGCGVVVLKRLSDALAAGDPVLALVRGSAVNQDGHSGGLTVPNGPAQQAVIEQALAESGLLPADIDYVEAHGTGTPLGDPIELHALHAALGRGRTPENPLLVGSVKTNLGHLEAAAGIAGLIKTVLMLQQGTIAPHLHFQTPGPQIAWDEIAVQVPTTPQPWPTSASPERPRRAGVSSFGLSGTNAHAILSTITMENAALRVENEQNNSPLSTLHSPFLLPLSAKTVPALHALATGWLELARSPDPPPLADAAYTAAVRRTHHPHRLAVVAASWDEVATAMHAFVNQRPAPGLVQVAALASSKVAFVFPGQGGQWPGMARQLLASEPVFREALEACEQAFVPYVTWSLREVLTDDSPEPFEQIDIIQPTLFAVQVALARLLHAWGVQAAAVVGHSMGEVAAAHIAGALSLEAAARIICLRSRLLRQVGGQGAMAMVELSPAEVQQVLAEHEHTAGRVVLAAVNSARSSVLAGELPAVQRVLEHLTAQGIFNRLIRVDVASHSPAVDPLLPELRAALRPVQPQPASIPLYSTVNERVPDGQEMNADYWAANLRQPVQFAAAVARLLADGCTTLVEISPHPVLSPAIEQDIPHAPSAMVISTLRRNQDEQTALLECLGRLYVQGVPLNWRNRYPAGQVVPLPTYPWQHQRYWVETAARPQPARQLPATLQGWLQQVYWQALPLPDEPDTPPGHWLVLADEATGTALCHALEARGQHCTLLPPEEAANLATHVQVAATARHPLRGVLHLWALADTTGDTPDPAAPTYAGVLALVQALASLGLREPPRLWLITRDTQAIQPGEMVVPRHAPLWGVGRVVALEQPDLRCTCLDIAEDLPAIADLAALLLADPDEDQLALRGDGRDRLFAARLAPLRAAPAGPPQFPADATYLLTGGLGALGLLVARWLVENGARHLVLVGRSDPRPSAEAALADLRNQGATVVAARADVADQQQLAAVFQQIAAELPPLRGILHSAVVLDDATLPHLTPARLAKVWAAKVAGAWNLHTLSRGLPLDWFVLFSSGAALLGSPGQASYAAANAFLDALAHTRQAQGLPALSINWGPWAELGQAAASEQRGERLALRGVGSLTPQQGLTALQQVWQCGLPQVAVLRVDLRQWSQYYPQALRLSLLREMAPFAASPTAAPPSEPAPDLRSRLLAAEAGRRRRALLETCLRERVAQVLRTDPHTLAVDTPFSTLGFDSLMTLELRNLLEAESGLRLPVGTVWSHPTIQTLGAHLAESLDVPLDSTAPTDPTDSAPPAAGGDFASLLDQIDSLSDADVERLLGGG